MLPACGPGAGRAPGDGWGQAGCQENQPSGARGGRQAAGSSLRGVGRRPRGHISVGVCSYGLGYEIAPGTVEFEESSFLSAASCTEERGGKERSGR